ncbi:uncharacterized protein [Ambystoma mexicanum]|uniref:uncharacterized protein n=1 Tax=Ambystoma mexicanum TaxID=8296 RepID=UPI0037E8BFDB
MIRLSYRDPLYPEWEKDSYFREGEFLTNDQVFEELRRCRSRDGFEPVMLERRHSSLQRSPAMLNTFLRMEPGRFPVLKLKHATIFERFHAIVDEGRFRGEVRKVVLKKKPVDVRVSCWGVHIAPENRENARQKRFRDFLALAGTAASAAYQQLPKQLKRRMGRDLRDMLTNSPAISPDSLYGNLQFSFRVSELLSEYRKQHCSGKKPVLRVLGTEAYKLEIVHWILIHKPGCNQAFGHLPELELPGPFSRDGNLMWAPESMTDHFTWWFDPSGALMRKPLTQRDRQTYDPWVWNNVVFAFHLPAGSVLSMCPLRLLANVEACETLRDMDGAISRMVRHGKSQHMTREEAEEAIEKKKWRYGAYDHSICSHP